MGVRPRGVAQLNISDTVVKMAITDGVSMDDAVESMSCGPTR